MEHELREESRLGVCVCICVHKCAETNILFCHPLPVHFQGWRLYLPELTCL